MTLTIKVIYYKEKPLNTPLNATFNEKGGTVGRSEDNHLVLADDEKVVSSIHAAIEYQNGCYYFVDNSLNGTQIINRNQLVHHKKIRLYDQDKLRIGDYDLLINVTDEDYEILNAVDPPQKSPSPKQRFSQKDSSPSFFDKDNDEKYIDSKNESFIPPVSIENSKQNSDLPKNLTLEDFFGNEEQNSKEEENISAPLRPPSPSKPSFRSTPVSDRWLDIFFKAAGIENTSNFPENEIPELMHTLGTILIEFIGGLMRILRGRTELKSQLRVAMTTFKATENNPLKFSPSVEMVIKTLLIDKNPGFLDAVEAVREGFEDIKNHELAINAGIQVSLLHILKRFDPHQFEKKFEERLVLNKKAKCWEEYRQTYQQLIEEALDNFFGEVFVRAYEEQMDKLRSVRKG